MTVVFWILTVLLAVAFLGAGGLKVSQSSTALAGRGMGWVEDFSDSSVKLIGAAEVVGAVGLVLPRLLKIAPVLSPIAALCLAAMMVGAVVVHVRRKEPPTPAAVLAVLSVVTAVLGFATA